MTSDLEARVLFLEQLSSRVDWALQNLKLQLQTVSNQQRQGGGGQAGGDGSGSSLTLYTCTVPSAVTGPTTIPSVAVTPILGSGSGGTVTLTVSIPGPTVAGKMGYVLGGSGTYVLIGQSCT